VVFSYLLLIAVAGLMRKTDPVESEIDHVKLERFSRILVVVWGVVLVGFIFVLFAVMEEIRVSVRPFSLEGTNRHGGLASRDFCYRSS
jgi:hypothetical protein